MKGLQNARRELFTAISDNDVEKVQSILTHRNLELDINGRDEAHGLQTTLMRACHMHITPEQRSAILNVLSRHNPNVNIQDGAGRTALCHACIAEKKEVLEFLSGRHGVDPNVADVDGNTALIYAVRSRNADIVQSFLTAFRPMAINVNYVNAKGQCALSEASKHHDSAICRLLVDEGGADTSVLNNMSFPSPRSARRTPRPPTPRDRQSPSTPRRIKQMGMEPLHPVLPFRALSRADANSHSEPDLLRHRFKEVHRLNPFTENLRQQDSTSSNSLPDLKEEVHEEVSDEEEALTPPPNSLSRSRRGSLSMPDLREDLQKLHLGQSALRHNASTPTRGSPRDEVYPHCASPRLQRKVAPYMRITEEEATVHEAEERLDWTQSPKPKPAQITRLLKRRGSTSLPDLRDCLNLVSRMSESPESSIAGDDERTDDDLFELSIEDPVSNEPEFIDLKGEPVGAPYTKMPQLSINQQVACSLPDINRPSRQGFNGRCLSSAKANKRAPNNHVMQTRNQNYRVITSKPKVKLTTTLDIHSGKEPRKA